MRKTFNTRHKKKYCKQNIEFLLRKTFNTTRYKNKYYKQDIEFLLRKVKVIKVIKPASPTKPTDLKDFGAPDIHHLALAISENYDEATKKYKDPYDNNRTYTLDIKSMKDLGLVYDHIIPSKEVWKRAAHTWSEKKKTEYVFDPVVGVITSQHTNANKSTKCLVEFLNSKEFNGDKRSFCLSWLVIAVKYDIPLTQNEKNEIDNELENGSFPVKVINPMKPW